MVFYLTKYHIAVNKEKGEGKSGVSDINKLVNVKRFGTSYKMTLLKFEPRGDPPMKKEGLPDQVANDQKLKGNISRTKARIFEIAMCNPWEWFITCTLDQTKYARDDLETFRKDLAQFIRNQRKKRYCDIKYMLIPELHDDGINWHMHGLINGLPLEALKQFTLQDKIPTKMKRKICEGTMLYNWLDYAHKFGFVSLEAVRNSEAVSKYVTKYITKDLSKTVQEIGSRMFYSSQGLKGHELIARSTLARAPDEWEFENDYVKIKWIEGDEVDYYIRDGTQTKEPGESANSLALEEDPGRP